MLKEEPNGNNFIEDCIDLGIDFYVSNKAVATWRGEDDINWALWHEVSGEQKFKRGVVGMLQQLDGLVH